MSSDPIQQDFVTAELSELAILTAPCLGCTTCASACPVFQIRSDRNPRILISRIASGAGDDALEDESVWWCGACYTCEAHCPQGVPLTHVLFRLKNLAVKLGKPVPQSIARAGENLRSGAVIPCGKKATSKRREMGLPDLPAADQTEITTILTAAGFPDTSNQEPH